jgi:hypothetical protein
MQIDTSWLIEHWQTIVIVILLVREFLNNLLTNCPFLKANKSYELLQGIFNALAATVTKSSSKKETTSTETINTPSTTIKTEETTNEKIPDPAAPDSPVTV